MSRTRVMEMAEGWYLLAGADVLSMTAAFRHIEAQRNLGAPSDLEDPEEWEGTGATTEQEPKKRSGRPVSTLARKLLSPRFTLMTADIQCDTGSEAISVTS